MLLTKGAIIDRRYEIMRPIGQGGMGRVVEVRRIGHGLHLALKYCDSRSPRRKRMVREVRLLQSLDHAHLVPVLDANLDHDPPYFIMPLALSTLEDELHDHAGDFLWSIDVFRQICLGVQALHASGVVHRDLKPANVLRLDDGRHVVADLGTAKREPRDSTVLTRTCAVLGTLAYLAPEQLLPGGCREAGASTDVYQLGKILYQMITSCLPVVVEPSMLPWGLDHIILRATATQPAERYATVTDLLVAVDTYEASACGQEPEHPSTVLERLAWDLHRRSETKQYRGEHRDDILGSLSSLGRLESDDLADAFDRLPAEVLATLARDMPRQFLPPFHKCTQGMERTAAHRDFAYADVLAQRMKAVIQATRDPKIQTCALQSLLVAAVVLNRYSAMATVRQLLYQITRPEIALPVAEMLRAHRDYLHEIVPGLCVDRLHPILRGVVDELEWIETVSF
jgi:serine/threonine protein kinase